MKTGETAKTLFGEKLLDKNSAKKFVENAYDGGEKPKLLKAPDQNGVVVEHSGKTTTVTVAPGGFSPLSIYNYLSSEFNGRSITMTSATNTSSLIARSNHYSVNLVGGGMLSFLYWLQSVFLMFTVSVVGVMYISGIIKDSVSSAFVIIGNMFKVSVGVVNGIARITGAFVLMLLSVFGTVFFYQIFKEILFAIPVALSKMLALAPSADNAIVVSSYEGLACILTCIICFFIGQVALKNRKEFIHGFDKTIESIVHQIIRTNPGNGTKLNPETPTLRQMGNQLANGVLGKKNEDGVREGGGLRMASDGLRTASEWGGNMAEKAKNSKTGQYVGGAVYAMKEKRKVKRIAKSGGSEKPKGSFKQVGEQLKQSPLATIGGGINGAIGKVKDAGYAVTNYNSHRNDLAELNAEKDANGETLVSTSRRASVKELMNQSAENRQKERLSKLSKHTEKQQEVAHRDKEIEYNALFGTNEKLKDKEKKRDRKARKKAGDEYSKSQVKARKQMNRRGYGQDKRK